MSGATATTLVIDDEGLVRHLVRRMLEPELCQVVEAEDGAMGLHGGPGGRGNRAAAAGGRFLAELERR